MQTNGRGQRSPFQEAGSPIITVAAEAALFRSETLFRSYEAHGLAVRVRGCAALWRGQTFRSARTNISWMHKYGHKNRIGITLRRHVNHCDGSRDRIRCALRPACGTEHSSAPKKRPAGIENLGTAGGATRNGNRKIRASGKDDGVPSYRGQCLSRLEAHELEG